MMNKISRPEELLQHELNWIKNDHTRKSVVTLLLRNTGSLTLRRHIFVPAVTRQLVDTFTQRATQVRQECLWSQEPTLEHL